MLVSKTATEKDDEVNINGYELSELYENPYARVRNGTEERSVRIIQKDGLEFAGKQDCDRQGKGS